MDELSDLVDMVPYPMLFPTAGEGVVSLYLPNKVGKAKAGGYTYIEAYCVQENCDCRRVSLLVVNEKGKIVAVIEFGFDPDGPYAGPFLNENEKQSAAAADLLQIFVEALNDNTQWLKGMYRHYKEVRKKLDGRAYKGRPFPKPGSLIRQIVPPAPGFEQLHAVEEDFSAAFEQLLRAAVNTLPMPGGRRWKKANQVQESLFPELGQSGANMHEIVQSYQVEEDGFSEMHRKLQTELRRYIFKQKDAADELANLIVKSFVDDEEDSLDAALRVLDDTFEILRVELERSRPEARQRMEQWQTALAQYIYAPGIAAELGAMVTQVLLNSRVEILPLLHEANSQRMFDVSVDPEFDANPEEAMLGLLAELDAEGRTSSFDFLDAILQTLAVGDVDVQIGICALMMQMESSMIREAGALMLFHPHAEVRAGVAQGLSEIDGERLTSAALRRLILSRNWFSEELRSKIDQAIANARRARVECAPLAKPVNLKVYASGVDGALAQLFQIMLPQKKGFLCCGLMPKIGSGIADAYVIPQMTKAERSQFLKMLATDVGATEVAPDYLDLRVRQSLADGAAQGKMPSHWLLAIAESLGRDWQAVPLDVVAELSGLRASIMRMGGRFITEKYKYEALEASGRWHLAQRFADSWFEDDVEVDAVVRKAQGRKKNFVPDVATAAVVKQILQPRRQVWLERLVLTTLWLKAAIKSPLAWQQMFYVAEAVADDQIAIEDIPLMMAIAESSVHAYLGRLAER